MAKKTQAIDWSKLLSDLQNLQTAGLAVADVVKEIISDLLPKSESAKKARSAKPLKCDPGCFQCSLELLEHQRKMLCHSLCNNLAVTTDIESCCSDQPGGH